MRYRRGHLRRPGLRVCFGRDLDPCEGAEAGRFELLAQPALFEQSASGRVDGRRAERACDAFRVGGMSGFLQKPFASLRQVAQKLAFFGRSRSQFLALTTEGRLLRSP